MKRQAGIEGRTCCGNKSACFSKHSYQVIRLLKRRLGKTFSQGYDDSLLHLNSILKAFSFNHSFYFIRVLMGISYYLKYLISMNTILYLKRQMTK